MGGHFGIAVPIVFAYVIWNSGGFFIYTLGEVLVGQLTHFRFGS